jgi:hypothetical protein
MQLKSRWRGSFPENGQIHAGIVKIGGDEEKFVPFGDVADANKNAGLSDPRF